MLKFNNINGLGEFNMYKSEDIQWIYSQDTGSIPYILNNEKTKAKVITDGTIIPFYARGTINDRARKAVAEHYGIETDNMITYHHLGDIAAHKLNMFQYLILFRGLPSYRDNIAFSKSQIKLMKYWHDKHENKIHKKKLKAQKTAKKKEAYFNKEREF